MPPCRPTRILPALLVSLWSGVVLHGARGAEAFVDPAPPAVVSLPDQPAPAAQKNDDATFRAAPKPLPAGATTTDWTDFLGPTHNAVSAETKLLEKFPKGGPAVVWEMNKGESYSAPAVLGDRLVLFHRVGNQEVVDCLHAQTGERFWRHAYPSAYRDRYGYCDGPRASPVIAADPALAAGGGPWAYTLGAEGKLHCLQLSTGRVKWTRNLLMEFKSRQNFFGVGTTPLIEGDKLVVNVGAPAPGPCVAAFDLATGKMAWGASSGEQAWGPSYASPVPATLHGNRRVLVFAGGETGPRAPVTGGLLCIDPADGAVDFTFPWRGNRRESVNASSPLVIGDQVLISECYGAGGALLDVGPDFNAKPAWTNEAFGTHFMTAVAKGDHLYGIDGHGPADAFLVCVERKTGKEVWRTQPEWTEQVGGRVSTMGTYRSQLLQIDGRTLCLGEYGHLLWIDLQPTGYKELDRAQLFAADQTWTPPVVSRGLLYVMQNEVDRAAGTKARIICYDLRAEK